MDEFLSIVGVRDALPKTARGERWKVNSIRGKAIGGPPIAAGRMSTEGALYLPNVARGDLICSDVRSARAESAKLYFAGPGPMVLNGFSRGSVPNFHVNECRIVLSLFSPIS